MQHHLSERNTFMPIAQLLQKCSSICTTHAMALNVYCSAVDDPFQQGMNKIIHYETALARVLATAARRDIFDQTSTYLQYTLDATDQKAPESAQDALENLIAANNLIEKELSYQQEKTSQESIEDLFRDLVAGVNQHNRLIANVIVSFDDV